MDFIEEKVYGPLSGIDSSWSKEDILNEIDSVCANLEDEFGFGEEEEEDIELE